MVTFLLPPAHHLDSDGYAVLLQLKLHLWLFNWCQVVTCFNSYSFSISNVIPFLFLFLLRSTHILSTLGRLNYHLWYQCCAIYLKIKVTPIPNTFFLTNGIRSTSTLQFGGKNMVKSRFYTFGKAGNENMLTLWHLCMKHTQELLLVD